MTNKERLAEIEEAHNTIVNNMGGYYNGAVTHPEGKKGEIRHTDVDFLISRVKALEARNEKLREALEFYACFETWDKDLFMVGSSAMRNDLEETSHSRFTPGMKARKALSENTSEGG